MRAQTQSCPNCQTVHDVTVYVSGQRVLCRCGIRFEVRRTDVSQIGRAPSQANAITQGAHSASAVFEEEDKTFVRDPSSVPVSLDDSGVAEGGAAPEQGPRGLVLPGYELVEILGKGGMGEVWRAHQKSLGRTVAIKLLPPKLAKDKEFVARFEKEATALASLSHPNIIQIIDRGVAGDHYYFVMELVEGRSLREVMNAGRLSAQDALRIIAQVCRAIDYAHEKDIIHRDLKPENILVDGRGHVKVADFGLAGIRGMRPELQLTATAVAMGTVNYMAPEQRRDAKNVDGRADLYSLGVMLYELLTGELPLGRFKLPSEKIAGLDVRVDEVVAKTLETEPEARFERASQVGSALEDLIGSAPRLPTDTGPGGTGRNAVTARVAKPSFVQTGWKGLRRGLSVVGALALLGIGIRMAGWTVTVEGSDRGAAVAAEHADGGNHRAHGHVAAGTLPRNTDGDLYSDFQIVAEKGKPPVLTMSFPGGSIVPNGHVPDAEATKGKEKVNAHAGDWNFVNGRLVVTQAGDVPAGDDVKLIPRAYLARRYFSTDSFEASIDMVQRPLEACFPEDDSPSASELSMRIRNFFVTVMAIPGTGLRLGWKYTGDDGLPVQGNSTEDVQQFSEDEVPVPPPGTPFRVGIRTEKRRGGTFVQATINGRRFATKFLPGLEDQVAKVAVGCRNLHCEFDNLSVRSQPVPRPKRPVAKTE